MRGGRAPAPTIASGRPGGVPPPRIVVAPAAGPPVSRRVRALVLPECCRHTTPREDHHAHIDPHAARRRDRCRCGRRDAAPSTPHSAASCASHRRCCARSSTATGSAPTSSPVHLDLVDRFLHHHHSIEDDLLWPKLLHRVPTEIAPVVEMMEDRSTSRRRAARARRSPIVHAWRMDADSARAAAELAEIYSTASRCTGRAPGRRGAARHAARRGRASPPRSGGRSARPPSAARRSRTRRACSACSPTTATRRAGEHARRGPAAVARRRPVRGSPGLRQTRRPRLRHPDPLTLPEWSVRRPVVRYR